MKRGVEAEGEPYEHLSHLFDTEVSVFYAQHARKQGPLAHALEDLRFMAFDIEDKKIQAANPRLGDQVRICDSPYLVLDELASFLGKCVAVRWKVRKAAVPEVVSVLGGNYMSKARHP